MEERRNMIMAKHLELSIRHQCELLRVSRSTIYYEPVEACQENVTLMNEIRDIWIKRPFYGYRRITIELKSMEWSVNHKRVQRLMALAGIEALYAKPKTSLKNKAHTIYPYLLKGLLIERPNQTWQVDITYLRMRNGFMYLTAIIDVYSRYVLGWSLSNTLETGSCLEALKLSLLSKKPEIMNSDQGCQFTSEEWINALKDASIKISMTGKGRCLDNVYIERFWRSFKQEEFYLNDYVTVAELKKAITVYIKFYNNERWHQSLDYKRPADLYFSNVKKGKPMEMIINSVK